MTLLAVIGFGELPVNSYITGNEPEILAGFETRQFNSSSGPYLSDTGGRRTGQRWLATSAYVNSSSARGVQKNLRQNKEQLAVTKPVTFWTGAALKYATYWQGSFGYAAGWWGFATTFQSGTPYGPGMWFNGDGSISVGWRTTNTSGTTSQTCATSAAFVPLDSVERWYAVQMRYTINADDTVVFEVIVDGTTRIAATANWNGLTAWGLSTVPYAMTAYDVMGIGYGIGDWWLCDNTGATNNGNLGNCRVESMSPTGAGANTGLTNVGGASSTASVSGSPDTVNYVRATAVGQKSTFALNDLADTSGTIRGVEVQSIAIKESSTLRVHKNVLRTGGADYQLASAESEPRLDLYRPVRSLLNVNPATGVAFTAAEVNAMEAGVQLVS